MPSSAFSFSRCGTGALCLAMLAGLAACGDTAMLAPTAGMGISPTLPQPKSSLIPTVNIAPATGWPEGAKPTAMAGLSVNALATAPAFGERMRRNKGASSSAP